MKKVHDWTTSLLLVTHDCLLHAVVISLEGEEVTIITGALVGS
jgi:uncharacterized membrane protein YGL010W